MQKKLFYFKNAWTEGKDIFQNRGSYGFLEAAN